MNTEDLALIYKIFETYDNDSTSYSLTLIEGIVDQVCYEGNGNMISQISLLVGRIISDRPQTEVKKTFSEFLDDLQIAYIKCNAERARHRRETMLESTRP